MKKTAIKCPQCNRILRKIEVRIQDADSPVTSYQCGKCSYFDFEESSIYKAIDEIRQKETVLKIKQKVVKLSQDRLGIYFNTHIVRSLGIQKGEDVYISVPDKKHIVLERAEKYG